MNKQKLLKVAKPILFNTEMVRAIQDDRKTVTRRVVPDRIQDKWYSYDEWANDKAMGLLASGISSTRSSEYEFYNTSYEFEDGSKYYRYARYQVGDILYVRETFGTYDNADYCLYKADYKDGQKDYMHDGQRCDLPKWKAPVSMPKEYARIFLRVTDVRVERLKDITEEEAVKEGVRVIPQAHSGTVVYRNYMHDNKNTEHWEYAGSIYHSAIASFASLWNSILKIEDWELYGWDANPWVFVYEFERIGVRG